MTFEVAVAGGGIMGLATAYALLRRGVRRVVVLERERVGHDRAASTDDTKAIRYEYADQEIYSRMVGRSIEMWRELHFEHARHFKVAAAAVEIHFDGHEFRLERITESTGEDLEISGAAGATVRNLSEG